MKKILFIKTIVVLMLCLNCTLSFSQGFEWAKSIGGTGADGTKDALANDFTYEYTCTDAAGNFYATGRYLSDTLHISGLSPLVNKGNADIYITKQDSAGNFIWAFSIGGANTDQPISLQLDPTGNYLYIMGYFTNATVDFDPGPGVETLVSNRSFDVFVAKYGVSSGNLIWARHINTNTNLYGRSGFTVGAYGDLYLTGNFAAPSSTPNSPDVDPGPAVVQPGNGKFTGIYIAKWDSAGNFVWVKELNGYKYVSTLGDSMSSGLGIAGRAYGLIATDENDNIYLTGSFNGQDADFDPGPGTHLLSVTPRFQANQWRYTGDEIFVVKLDASGVFKWAHTIGGKLNDLPSALILSNGHIYLRGTFQDTANFGLASDTFELIGTNSATPFIAKYDTAGKLIWAKRVLGLAGGGGFAVDKLGNIYDCGRFQGVADLDPGPDTVSLFSPLGEFDHFVRKLDTAGNFVWAETISAQGGNEEAISVCTDQSNNVYYWGNFVNTVSGNLSDGSAFSLTSRGNADIFFFKLACGASGAELSDTTCDNSYTFNDETYTESGTYIQRLISAAGCDSILTLHLTLAALEVEIVNNDHVLSATETYDSYQWLQNGTAINGATNSTYTVTENGNYQVVVTNEAGCTDTSDVLTIDDFTSIDEVQGRAKLVHIYPNPAGDRVNISAPFTVHVSLSDISGRLLEQRTDVKTVNLEGYAKGIYVLKIFDKEHRLIKAEKLVKE